MKSRLPTLTLLLLVVSLSAHAQDLNWLRSFGGSSQDQGMQGIATSDGGYLAIGSTRSFKGGPQAHTSGYTVKTDKDGVVEWEHAFGTHLITNPRAVYAVSDGYIVLGSVQKDATSDEDPWIAKLDLGGTIAWEKVHHTDGAEPIYAATPTEDGGYLMMGDGSNGVLLVKVSSSGNFQWRKEYRGMTIPRGLDQTSDKGFVITGITTGAPALNGDIALLRVSASGDSLWCRLYGTTASEDGFTVRQTQDSGFLIVGTRVVNSESDLYIIRTDANGIYRSSQVVVEPGENNRVLQMIRYRDGFLAAGGTEISTTRSQVQLTMISEDGELLWSKRYGPESANSYKYAYSIEEAPTGFILAGVSGYGDNADIMLMKIDNELGAVSSVRAFPTFLDLR